MYTNLIKTSTIDMTYNDWLLFRKNGIGASEVSAVLGENDYMHAVEVFYDKIQTKINYKPDNLAMYMGRLLENSVAESYKFYDESIESMMQNASTGKIVNNVFKSNMYIQNPNFPHLFVSLDRRLTGQNGALECKTMSGFVWRRGEEKVPTSYLLQCIQQAGVCGFDFVDIAILIDGRHFEVRRVEFHQNLFDGILEITTDFWEKVQKAKILNNRKYEAEINFNKKLVIEIEKQLMKLEPEPTSSVAYSDFMNEKYSFSEGGIIEGSQNMLGVARRHQQTKVDIKLLTENAQYYENMIKKEMQDNVELSFGKEGSIKWWFNKAGNRIFRNYLK